MLIYLDNAHISALNDLARRNPDEFAKFLEFWIERRCQLIISRAHLHEIGQVQDERDLENRLNLLRYFSIKSAALDENVDWVIIREIREQTLHRLRRDAQPASAAYLPIRDELYRSVSPSELADWVRFVRPGLLEEMHSRRAYAGFENRSMRLRKQFRKISDRKEPKWDPDGWKMMPFVYSTAPSSGGDPVADRWMSDVRDRTPDCWSRAKNKRQALLCMYDIKGLAATERAPEQDLSRLGFYRALGRHWVLPYCRLQGYAIDETQAALDLFDPYEAPAISAALAIERGRKRQEDKAYEASDYMDVDHVLWAAHADLAFVDKRTQGFLVQAQRNPDTAALLSPHLQVRFERAPNLTDVKKHITKLAEERSRAAE